MSPHARTRATTAAVWALAAGLWAAVIVADAANLPDRIWVCRWSAPPWRPRPRSGSRATPGRHAPATPSPRRWSAGRCTVIRRDRFPSFPGSSQFPFTTDILGAGGT